MIGDFGVNAGYVEELHARYRESPQNVDPEWRQFFEAAERGPAVEVRGNNGTNGTAHTEKAPSGNGTNGTYGLPNRTFPPEANRRSSEGGVSTEKVLEAGLMQGRVYQLLNAYRVRGHLFAALDPLGQPEESREPAPELDLENFGLREADLDVVFPAVGIGGLGDTATLRQIITHLEETYCRSIGVEFTQIEDPEMRGWLQARMESTANHARLNRDESVRILTKLTDAEIFEQFIHKNYVGAKRFSLEGAESMIAMLDLFLEAAGVHGVDEIIIGMAHRGRLNVLCNIMGKDPREIFAQFDDKNGQRFLGRGDVKYHLGYSSDRATASGATVHLSLAFNPSHLEFVNPVVEGRVRAKQDRSHARSVMPLLIHGDAAFMGQGVVPETLNLAGLDGYSTGGTVHIVVNNQIGFTTNPRDSRSTRYCTDITRMLKVPVFHVNGEDPEAVIQVTRLAMEFRQKFAQDVVIDMYCYRRYGHNEADEPRFTQPLMYALIDKKPTVREVYVNRLVGGKQITVAEATQIADERRASLEKAHSEARVGDFFHPPNAMEGVWQPYYGGPDASTPEVATGVPREVLLDLLDRITTFPASFNANAKAKKVIEARKERIEKQGALLWDTAEALAFATLLREGRPIRLSGQDARRGTFSHRHAVLHDTTTGAPFTPLEHVNDGGTLAPQGRFQVWDSALSETGVLGFEYGYSLDSPEGLVIWEAQFGDFANGGQVIIDQFIASAEDKWLRLSGLVLLMPHGYDGAGPEHSSARIERWLQMAAEDNIQVCNPTTPAQFFHLLRRQVNRPWRKPLAVMTPKSLLRNPVATSTLDELVNGEFQRVIGDDSGTPPADVKRIILTSGKVFYDLHKARAERKRSDVAIIRLEQYYPFGPSLRAILGQYPAGTDLVWVQEEPKNMGAWYFIKAHLPDHIANRFPLRVVSRAESASPATGSHASHDLEQDMLVDDAFA